MNMKKSQSHNEQDEPVTQRQFTDAIDMINNSIEKNHEETLRHIDALAENIRIDLGGANKDEIAGIKDIQKDHENRIIRVEEHIGLR